MAKDDRQLTRSRRGGPIIMIDELAKALKLCLKNDVENCQGLNTSTIKKAEKLLKKYDDQKASDELIIQNMKLSPTGGGNIQIDLEKEVRELIYNIEEGEDFRKSYQYRELKRQLRI